MVPPESHSLGAKKATKTIAYSIQDEEGPTFLEREEIYAENEPYPGLPGLKTFNVFSLFIG